MIKESPENHKSGSHSKKVKKVQLLGAISLLCICSIPFLLIIGVIIVMSLNPGMFIGYKRQSWTDGMNLFLKLWGSLIIIIFVSSILTACRAIALGKKVAGSNVKSGIQLGSVTLALSTLFFLITLFVIIIYFY